MKIKDKKRVIVSQKLYPSQINELSLCGVIIKRDKIKQIEDFIFNNGGRVILSIPAEGVSSNNPIIQMLQDDSNSTYFVLCMCQKEIVDIFMLNLCREFNIKKFGQGKAFALDVLGYMGAKGPFVE